MLSNGIHSVTKHNVTDFERQIMDVYRANIKSVYEKYIEDKLTFEEAETEGKKLVSGYLYEHTQSFEPKNLNALFGEIMTCNSLVFVGQIDELKEIKHRLPARSVKTGQKFYTSKTHGYEKHIRYSLPDTGSATSDDKVPRNFRAVFESGIFHAWQEFILRLKSTHLRVRTEREPKAMKLESRILSFFVSFFGFGSFLSVILFVEKLRWVLERKN